MRRLIKKTLLTIQVEFPGLTDWKAAFSATSRRARNVPHETNFKALSLISLSGSKAFLDVGGALGQSVASIRLFFPNAPIVSFEPNPFFAARIRRMFRHVPTVRAETIALSDETGQFPLFVPAYKYTAFPELGTLDRGEAEHWLESRIFGYEPSYLTISEFRCPCATLDSLSLEPEFIKIDTRCNASKVLMGAQRTLTANRPAILLEKSPLKTECREYLRGLGYKNYELHNGTLVEQAPDSPCDLILTEQHWPKK